MGLDNHRVEVVEIKKRINTIQAKNNDKQLSKRLERQQNRPIYDKLAIESPLDRENLNDPDKQCTFRTDIDPKPDVQVRIYIFELFPFLWIQTISFKLRSLDVERI